MAQMYARTNVSYLSIVSQFNLTLCGRCFVCSNDRNEISAGDFRRVEVSEETKTGWTDKETLHLLEAITHYGDDWKKVAMHVGGRSEKECVAHFLKLPFGEQFVCHPDSEEVDKYSQTKNHGDAETKQEDAFLLSLAKKWHLTSFSDASNPIMAQMKEIQDKIVKFEEVESQMEREWKQLHQMKNLLFANQLTLLFRRTKSPLKIGESTEGVVQITDAAAVT